jgi:hypothetical protein
MAVDTGSFARGGVGNESGGQVATRRSEQQPADERLGNELRAVPAPPPEALLAANTVSRGVGVALFGFLMLLELAWLAGLGYIAASAIGLIG